jgi:hypothetical protein
MYFQSYIPATRFDLYYWSHIQAELLRVICIIGMLVSYETSYYNYFKYYGIKYTRIIILRNVNNER